MTTLDDLVASCHPDDDAHPRHRGLRTFGRSAALEVTLVAGLFAVCVIVDELRTRLQPRHCTRPTTTA